MNPAHLWKLKGPMWQYSKWMMGQKVKSSHVTLPPELPRELKDHAEFAAKNLSRMANEISATMRKHQLKLADRQCRMSELSSRVQALVVMLCTSLYAGRQKDELVRRSADMLCRHLTRQFTGKRPSDRDLRDLTELGAAIADNHPSLTAGIEPPPILMPYKG
jgi:hypothetical protein